jgi:hypothetical protein
LRVEKLDLLDPYDVKHASDWDVDWDVDVLADRQTLTDGTGNIDADVDGK